MKFTVPIEFDLDTNSFTIYPTETMRAWCELNDAQPTRIKLEVGQDTQVVYEMVP